MALRATRAHGIGQAERPAKMAFVPALLGFAQRPLPKGQQDVSAKHLNSCVGLDILTEFVLKRHLI